MWPQAPCMYTSIQYMGMGMKQLNSSDKQTVVVHKWGKWQKFCLNQRYTPSPRDQCQFKL